MSHSSNDRHLQERLLFLCREIVHPSIDSSTRLIEEGLLDSFHTLKLATAVEEAFGFTIDLASLEANDVESVDAMCAYVRARLEGAR